jgi:hypothetical protein
VSEADEVAAALALLWGRAWPGPGVAPEALARHLGWWRRPGPPADPRDLVLDAGRAYVALVGLERRDLARCCRVPGATFYWRPTGRRSEG